MVKIFKLGLVSLLVNNLYADNYGRLLLYGNCTTCHHIEKSISAPSMKIIKKRYLLAFPEKKDFVSFMSQWILKPNKDNSIMHDMIDKYELMPELGYDKDTLEKIAEYVYDTDL
jgi:hypothetical protein